MAKRANGTARKNGGPTEVPKEPTTESGIEQRVVAFAEQLGRIAGTVQARAEKLTRTAPATKKSAAALRPRPSKGRSGGVVDARGKKHRKPVPSDPDARPAASQAAKMRTARTMVKTSRRRGRG